MGDVDVDRDGSDPRARAMVRVRCSVSCTGLIRLCLHLGFGSDVRATARFNYSVRVRHG